ncbi:MAG TPA: MBL fold metallo-hydrolase [Alphaproteobacteria bacterium]|nr:MBL fold metallo-hydrolase [Alphaproteobacteria bacterium]
MSILERAFGWRARTGMSVTFWGVRGSIACSGPDYVRYGGNTSCVEVEAGMHRVIFDAGTGLRPLGLKLVAQQTKTVDIFLSHTHFDHVCGWPFFAPAYDKGTRINLWSGHLHGSGLTTRSVMMRLMEAPLFPVAEDVFQADISYRDLDAQATLVPAPGLTLTAAPLNHPNGATGYRLTFGSRSLVYASDHEHQGTEPLPSLLKLAQGADLLIYDATYSPEAYPAHAGWGHSTWEEGLRLAIRAKARALALFHHEPSHTDDMLAKLENTAKRAGAKHGIKVFAAREGVTVRV